jgi:hypothetical protein
MTHLQLPDRRQQMAAFEGIERRSAHKMIALLNPKVYKELCQKIEEMKHDHQPIVTTKIVPGS